MRYRPPNPDEIVLKVHEGRLEARGPNDPPGSGVRAEWLVPCAPTRSGAKLGRTDATSKSPLIRALGDSMSVIDATGGFGVDAWTLACAGRSVLLIERSPILAALLRDALASAQRDDPLAAARLTLIEDDAREVLAAIAAGKGPTEAPDAVYLDPMFPPKRRASALPSKPMQFLTAIVGADLDAGDLLAVARRVARKRVVVKRPPHAAPLALGATSTIETKLLRFDIYLPASGGDQREGHEGREGHDGPEGRDGREAHDGSAA